MSQYKDFQGKTLDDAIREACAYYGVAREKLEIEIISDAKSGIFGLVGAKKASIRAARVQLPEFVSPYTPPEEAPPVAEGSLAEPGVPGQAEPASPSRSDAHRDRPQRDSRENGTERAPEKSRSRRDSGTRAAGGRGSAHGSAGARSEDADSGTEKPSGTGVSENAAPSAAASPSSGNAHSAPANSRGSGRRTSRSTGGKDESEGSARPRSRRNDDRNPAGKTDRREPRRGPGQARSKGTYPAAVTGLASDALDASRDDLPEFSLEGCDRDELFAVVCGVVQRLVEPIVGDVPCTVEIHGNRVRASVDCGDASGLLVGREGQTLAAVQYLASRIIAKRIGGSLRLNIDAGNYRERQDDKLKDLALSLAERAKATRRAQSTRPLSAYQRRIIHLALEEDDAVQTHSKGEGAQRRVIIQLKRAAWRGNGKDEEERDSARAQAADGDPAANPDATRPLNPAEPSADPDFLPEPPDHGETREE